MKLFKLLLFSIAVFIGYSAAELACAKVAKAQTFVLTTHSTSVYDTVAASGEDTIVPNKQLITPYCYSWWYKADSLSGATDAKLYLEIAPYGRTQWYRLDSVTVDGVTTQGYKTGVIKTGGGWRLRTKAGSGTQSTKVEQYMQTFRCEGN